MITINSHCVNSACEAKSREAKLEKQTLFYKIACLCYLLIIIVLLTFFVVRAFKYKYHLEPDCESNAWIDTVITILTLVAIFLASALLIASLKYVSESETFPERLEQQKVRVSIDKTEDFIRRNSQSQQHPVSITRNPSVHSGSWLSAVRTEAYESHRRMSMAPSGSVLALPKPHDTKLTI